MPLVGDSTLFWWVSAGAIVVGVIAIYFAFVCAVPLPRKEEIRWDWNQLLFNQEIKFSKDFLWGSATSSHQVEGNCKNNNWHVWEQGYDQQSHKPRIKKNQKSGQACDHWNRYKEDIQLMKEIGLNAYRFSIEWSKIEPEKGRIDKDAVQHYHDVIDECLRNGLDPMITLFHFTYPIWFAKMGAFEKEENIRYFVDFSLQMYDQYGSKVRKWCTLNEPEVYAGMGYVVGIFPPGKTADFRTLSHVLLNMYTAHVRIYRAIKALPGGDKSLIGFAKNIAVYDPFNRFSLLDQVLVGVLDNWWNQLSETFFSTGVWDFSLLGLAYKHHKDLPQAVGALDFLGLNYYTHIAVKGQIPGRDFVNFIRAEYPKTDMDYGVYAEGMYRALHRVAHYKVPIYITENGIADAKDELRKMWIERHMFAVKRAMQDGIDVRGFYYWSLLDNFEWAEGYDMRFGLYEVNFDTQERRLREGSKTFVDIVQRSRGIK